MSNMEYPFFTEEDSKTKSDSDSIATPNKPTDQRQDSYFPNPASIVRQFFSDTSFPPGYPGRMHHLLPSTSTFSPGTPSQTRAPPMPICRTESRKKRHWEHDENDLLIETVQAVPPYRRATRSWEKKSSAPGSMAEFPKAQEDCSGANIKLVLKFTNPASSSAAKRLKSTKEDPKTPAAHPLARQRDQTLRKLALSRNSVSPATLTISTRRVTRSPTHRVMVERNRPRTAPLKSSAKARESLIQGVIRGKDDIAYLDPSIPKETTEARIQRETEPCHSDFLTNGKRRQRTGRGKWITPDMPWAHWYIQDPSNTEEEQKELGHNSPDSALTHLVRPPGFMSRNKDDVYHELVAKAAMNSENGIDPMDVDAKMTDKISKIVREQYNKADIEVALGRDEKLRRALEWYHQVCHFWQHHFGVEKRIPKPSEFDVIDVKQIRDTMMFLHKIEKDVTAYEKMMDLMVSDRGNFVDPGVRIKGKADLDVYADRLFWKLFRELGITDTKTRYPDEQIQEKDKKGKGKERAGGLDENSGQTMTSTPLSTSDVLSKTYDQPPKASTDIGQDLHQQLATFKESNKLMEKARFKYQILAKGRKEMTTKPDDDSDDTIVGNQSETAKRTRKRSLIAVLKLPKCPKVPKKGRFLDRRAALRKRQAKSVAAEDPKPGALMARFIATHENEIDSEMAEDVEMDDAV